MNPFDNLIQFIKSRQGQARGGKYYKRVWHNERWKYFYTKEEYDKGMAKINAEKARTAAQPSLFERIGNFFGIQPSQAKSQAGVEYSKHELSAKGIALSEWIMHFSKYFQDKQKIDARFNHEKARKESGSKEVNTAPGKKELKKSVYKESIFRVLYNLYGENNGKDRTIQGSIGLTESSGTQVSPDTVGLQSIDSPSEPTGRGVDTRETPIRGNDTQSGIGVSGGERGLEGAERIKGWKFFLQVENGKIDFIARDGKSIQEKIALGEKWRVDTELFHRDWVSKHLETASNDVLEEYKRAPGAAEEIRRRKQVETRNLENQYAEQNARDGFKRLHGYDPGSKVETRKPNPLPKEYNFETMPDIEEFERKVYSGEIDFRPFGDFEEETIQGMIAEGEPEEKIRDFIKREHLGRVQKLVASPATAYQVPDDIINLYKDKAWIDREFKLRKALKDDFYRQPGGRKIELPVTELRVTAKGRIRNSPQGEIQEVIIDLGRRGGGIQETRKQISSSLKSEGIYFESSDGMITAFLKVGDEFSFISRDQYLGRLQERGEKEFRESIARESVSAMPESQDIKNFKEKIQREKRISLGNGYAISLGVSEVSMSPVYELIHEKSLQNVEMSEQAKKERKEILGTSSREFTLEQAYALSQAMMGNQNAKKPFTLEQESEAPKQDNLFGITPQTEKKFLNKNFVPPLAFREPSSLGDFVAMVKDSLTGEGMDDRAKEWVDAAYASNAKGISDLLNLAYKYVVISGEQSNKIRKALFKDKSKLKAVEALDMFKAPQENNFDTMPDSESLPPLEPQKEKAIEAVQNVKDKWSQKKQSQINAQIREILDTVPPDQITEQQKEILRMYEGSGGQATNEAEAENKGMLYEFFTPRKIIAKMQDILLRYLPPGAEVLEPSAGIGRFAEDRGSLLRWDMLQYNPDDPTAYRIAKILHPELDIKDKAFEQLFIDDRNRSVGKNYKGKKYKGVGGNPPYGDIQGKFKAIEGKGFRRYEHYFISRGLDVLEEGGLLTYIVPQSFLNAGNQKWKNEIFGKAELVEAYRMPEGAFGNTQIGTDVIVLRKNTTGTQDNRLAFAGEYFQENPDHVFGEELERKNRFGREEKYIKGDVSDFENFQFPEPKPMSQAQKDAISRGLMGNQNAKGERGRKIAEENKEIAKKAVKVKESVQKAVKKEVDPKSLFTQEEFQAKYGKNFDSKDIEIVRNLAPTGEISPDIPFDPDKMAVMGGANYPLYLYASGDIREKLRTLEQEKDSLPPGQYERQKKILEQAIPKPIGIDKIIVSPIEKFARGFVFDEADKNGFQVNLVSKFKEYLRGTPVQVGYGRRKKTEYRNPGVPKDFFTGYTASLSDVLDYLDGKKVGGRNEEAIDPITGLKVKLDTNKTKKKERREIADKLFLEFLNTVLTNEEKREVEDKWNEQFNSTIAIDGSKIPVLLDGMSKSYNGKEQDMRDTQTNYLARYMAQGVGCATHEVGLGKTWTGMAANVSALQTGKCKKPLIVVPTSVLQKWDREFRKRFPNVPVQMLGTPELNKLSTDGNFSPPDGMVTIMSYDAFSQFGFTDERYNELTKAVKDQISNPDAMKDDEKSKKKAVKETEKAESVVSNAIKGTSNFLKFDEAGFDHITIDEAHNFNNIFVDQASKNRFGGKKGDDLGIGENLTEEEKEELERVNEFDGLTGGTPSARGIKLWLAARHILEKNQDRNVLMLTATPFTNNPLQIYSLLSMIAKKRLEKMGIFTVRDFLATFVTTTNENMIEGNGRVVNKQVVKEFKNAHALQSLIAEYFDFQSGDANGVKRPKLKMKAVTLPLTPEMEQMRDKLEEMYDEKDEYGKPLEGAPLVSIQAQQMLNVSPALLKPGNSAAWSSIGDINPRSTAEFVERSPKLKFVADSVAGLYKKHKELKPGERMPAQLIFMPKGVDYMPEIKKYLVETQGIPPEAIEMLTPKTKQDKAKDPEKAKAGVSRFTEISDQFNSPDHPCKIIIGSDVIKEGVSLNKYTAVAYNTAIDWNPTTEVQKRGRHHRPGNALENVMWVDVLMEDSIDSKLYQKQSEKIGRINQVFEKTGDAAIDVSDINPDELKTDIIRDPMRKAQFVAKEEIGKLIQKQREINGKGIVLEQLVSDIRNLESTIKDAEESLKEDREDLNNRKKAIKLRDKGEMYSHLTEDYKIHKSNMEWFENRVKKTASELSRDRAKLERLQNELSNKGFKDLDSAERKGKKFVQEAKAILNATSDAKLKEQVHDLQLKFAKELKEKEKNRIRTPLEELVANQVNEVLETIGVKEFKKSTGKFNPIAFRAKVRMYQFTKAKA